MDKPTSNDMPLDGTTAPPMANGELIFELPWQGRIFGMARALCNSGLYEWDEFRDHLIAEISTWDAAAEPDQEVGSDSSPPAMGAGRIEPVIGLQTEFSAESQQHRDSTPADDSVAAADDVQPPLSSPGSSPASGSSSSRTSRGRSSSWAIPTRIRRSSSAGR